MVLDGSGTVLTQYPRWSSRARSGWEASTRMSKPTTRSSLVGGASACPRGHREEQTELDPGDALFFSGLVIHGSYANRSRDRFRRCSVGHYVACSTQSVAKFYHPVLAFSGEAVSCDVAA